jgi:hypothetical protein
MLDKMEDNQSFNLIENLNDAVFNLISGIMFGKEESKMVNERISYLNKNGTTDQITLREFINRIAKDLLLQGLHPKTMIFPFLNYYNIGNPFSTDKKNSDCLHDAFYRITKLSKDPNSICSKIPTDESYSDKDKAIDIFGFLLGGTETSAHTIIASLFWLKKNPQVLAKLMKELRDNGITKEADLKEALSLETIQNMDYLSCVIKETLRIDTPAQDTFYYKALEKTTI